MQAISVKELRNKLPFVRSQLKKGQEFLLIHQSKPIAHITPVDSQVALEDSIDKDVEAAALHDLAIEDASPEEIQYYQTLK